MWVAAHALALPLLNLLSSHMPLNPLYVILGYAPTVGVIQAVILRMQYDPHSQAWRLWLLPTMLLPALGALAAVMVMVALAPSRGCSGRRR